MSSQIKTFIVEDDNFVGDLYKRALNKAGYEVEIETDGQKAFEQIKSDKYDLILLDLMLPNLSGIDILKQLRDDADAPKLHAKIIVITNLEYEGKNRHDIEKLADGYLLKADTTPHQLVEYLNQVSLEKS